MNNLKTKYWNAANKYTNILKTESNVIGIILCGSLVNATLHKNSDIDIFVILDPGCFYRERGNTWIDDIEIEYFKNPPIQIRDYFIKEKNSPHTANMLATGKLVYTKNNIAKELIQEAKDLIAKGPKQISKVEIEFINYFLDDKFKDYEDMLNAPDKMAKELIKFDILNYSIDAFCKLNRLWRTKDKRLITQLSQINKPFSDLIELGIESNWDQEFLKTFRPKLENFLSGKREREWHFKSTLDI